MRNLVLVCVLICFFAVGMDQREQKIIPELWREINSNPKTIEFGELFREEIEDDFQFIMSAKKINKDTIVVYVSQLDGRSSQRFTEEFREKRTSLGNRGLFEMLKQERDEMNSNALDCLASHEESRLALFKRHREKQ